MSTSDTEQSKGWRQRAKDAVLIATFYDILREKAAAAIQFIAEHQEEIMNIIEALLKFIGLSLLAGLLWRKELKYLFGDE